MNNSSGRKSIFRSLFVPMIFIMLLQAALFYVAAVYGGIEESLSQNAADILSERLYNRKSELETRFNNRWTELDDCVLALDRQYELYEQQYGDRPLAGDAQLQKAFLADSAGLLVDTLRYGGTNGVFLIINSETRRLHALPQDGAQTYGLCIRDMDPDSNYSGREDLLLERSPSSIIDTLGCPLDSWWEAKYSFADEADGDYFYAPLNAAWDGLSSNSDDLAYFSFVHQLSGSDPKVVSYSLPLMAEDGYPYAVLGVELSVKYLASLLPNTELGAADDCSYVFAMRDGDGDYEPIAATGALYSRCFGGESGIKPGEPASTGGFTLVGRDGTELYAAQAELEIYNNNSPFEARRLALLAVERSEALFSYIGRIKTTLMIVSLLSLLLGMAGLALVSRRFAAPITALARRVRGMDGNKSDFSLGRLGIAEIDQLVDSIEELSRNVSRNSARTEFFSRMSHDMRTPMNAIISFSSAEMLEDADEAVKDDYLDKIHASGAYLLGLINEVLDMTKIESNKIELRETPVQASGLFATTIPIIEEIAKEKGLSFAAEIDIDPELTVMADVQHLSQVMMNLLSNAVKFTPAGGRVSLSARMLGEGAAQLCRVVVADTGVGMSESFMKKLYTPFAQENDRHEGTGLGLSIAKKLVELMNGTIDCESAQGVGTTFTVTLPLLPAEEPAPPSKAAPTRKDMSALLGKRVLVCEDSGINTTIITRLLERVGLMVVAVENGRLGVEEFGTSPPGTYDAVLMDIRMPVMDGLEASKAIRALPREDALSVPILAMTADAFAGDEESSKAAGMNAHLSKPVEPQKLYDTLLEYLA